MADSEASKEDKQLPASERRLQQAADEGNVARSRDAGHLLVLGAGLGARALAGAGIRGDLVGLLRHALHFDESVRGDTWEVMRQMAAPIEGALGLVLLVMMFSAVGAVAAGAIPGGINFAPDALGFKANRLNPLNGLKRIFSLRGFVEFLKLAVLAVLLGLIGAWFASTTLPEFASLSLGALQASLGSAAGLVVGGF